MSDAVLLVISMLSCLTDYVIRKYYSGKVGGHATSPFVMTAVSSLVTIAVLFFWGGFGTVSPFSLLLGVAFGFLLLGSMFATIRAFEIGPMSYSFTIICFSTVITAASGALFFGETLKILHIVGVVLMTVSIILAVEPKGEKKKASLRWLLYCLLAFLCVGGIGLLQKTHQSSVYQGEINEFLTLAFFSSFVLAAIFSWIFYRKQPDLSWLKTPDKSRFSLILIAAMILSGAAIAVNNRLNLYLSGRFDSAVFFPVVNGGGLILSMLASLILFREKLSKRQWLGVLIGIAANVILCLA